jgi:hypothetical protein
MELGERERELLLKVDKGMRAQEGRQWGSSMAALKRSSKWGSMIGPVAAPSRTIEVMEFEAMPKMVYLHVLLGQNV